jgi:type II secretory pathway component GspD/PulD (secretin)
MRQFVTYLTVVLGSLACEAVRADDPKADPGSSRVVSIEVLLADMPIADQGGDDEAGTVIARVREAEKQGKLPRATRLRLTTLSNQVAMAQFGERAAVATGRASFGGREFPGGGRGSGNMAESFTYQHVGTMVQVTPRVEGNKVLIQCDVEQSRLVPKAGKTPAVAGDPGAPAPSGSFQPDSIETITAKSVVQMKSGETVLLTSREHRSGDEASRTYILVTATVADDGHQDADHKDAALLKVFKLVNAKADVAAELLAEVTKEHRLRVAVDARTNSLLVHGNAEALEVCEALLLKIDEQ